ncbi:Methylsterol monooxygenase 1-1 [Linum perenne]
MLPYDSVEQATAHLGRNLTYAETLWFNYSSQKSDYFLYNHVIICVFLVYSLASLPIVLIQQFASFDKYKIQPNVHLSAAEIFKCYKHGALTFLFVLLPVELASYTLIKMVGIRTGLALPSGWEILVQILVYFVIEDYLSYWIHRSLHCKWLYKRIHKTHHEYEAPVAFVAVYDHWIETLMFGMPCFVGPALVPGHMLTL